MKNSTKRLMALFMVFSMIFSSMLGNGVNEVQAEVSSVSEDTAAGVETGDVESGTGYEEYEDTEDEEDIDLDDGQEEIDLKIKIISQWDKHYNAEVEIKNLTEDKIDDWEISFGFKNEIVNIWNANITEYDEELELYTIRNADWNQDIAAGGTVSFGMTVSYEDLIDSPRDWYLTRACLEAEGDYDVECTEYSRWDDTKINGQITITNHTDKRIEDWKLDIESNLSFEQVWGAELVDEEEASFDNADYNQNIEPGQSVSFGFIADCDGEKAEIYDEILYEMIEIPEELEGDEDWVDEYEENELAKYELERDDFDTDGEYQEYLGRHAALGLSVPSARSTFSIRSKAGSSTVLSQADKPIKTKEPMTLTDEEKKYTIINAGDKSVQTFYEKGSYVYLIQRDVTKQVKITKCKIKKSTAAEQKWGLKQGDKVLDLNDPGNVTMTLNKFNHGQSLEMFTYGGKEYMLLSAGPKNKQTKYGNVVAIIQFRSGAYTYAEFKDEKRLNAKFLTGIGQANKKHKNQGTPKQVEAALSEDMKTLLVWCEFYRGDKPETKGRKVQISCYKLKGIMKQLKKVEKKIGKKGKRVTLNFKHIDKKLCECTAIQSDKKETVVKPYGSLQAIDLENKKNGKYRVYLCGGNQEKSLSMYPGVAVMSLSCGKTPEQNSTYLCRTRVMVAQDTINADRLEMEGMHYRKGKVGLIISPANNTIGKDRQVLFSVDSDDVR